MTHQIANLAELPTELCELIRDDEDLEPKDIQNLSLVCKRFRLLCLPTIFYSVRLACTKAGLQSLQDLAKADWRHYVVHLSYYMPHFFEPKILEFRYFTETVWLAYFENVGGVQNEGGEHALSATELHASLCQRYEETKDIIDSGQHLAVLSTVLRELPQMTNLVLTFRGRTDNDEAAIDKIHRMNEVTMKRETYEHHIPLSRMLSVGLRPRGDISTAYV